MAFKNALIAFMAPRPSIIFYISFLNHYQNHDHILSPLWTWCTQHPLLLANTLNIVVGFWVISLLQSSNWMIDLYWTVIPVLLLHYFASHPLAEYNLWRSTVTWVWAIRLTHNYFRERNGNGVPERTGGSPTWPYNTAKTGGGFHSLVFTSSRLSFFNQHAS